MRVVILGAFSLLACSVAEPAAGMETAACVDGWCFGGLECLSDLCVAPDDDDDDGTGGGEAGEGPSGPSGSGSSNSASACSPTTTAVTAHRWTRRRMARR